MTPQIIIFLFFAFLGVLLSVFFWIKKTGDTFANRLLSIYTLLFSYEITYNCLQWSEVIYTPKFVHFHLTQFMLWLVYGPIVFIYVRRLVEKVTFKKSDALLFLPALLLFALFVPYYSLNGAEKLNAIMNNKVFQYAIFPNYGIWIVIVFMFFYGIYTYSKFKGHIKIGYKEGVWLKWFIGSYLGFVFLFALYIFLVRFNIMSYEYDYFIDAGIVFFIAMLAYFGFVQPDVFSGKKTISQVIPFVKYKKTGLSKALSLDLKENLLQIMENDKPYLDNDLRLDNLAELLKVSRNQTSQIINEHFNLSFFDFINKYRVEEAIILLSNPVDEDINITQIAYSAGFNNRASFYKAFKKFTNKTPSYFLKHQLVS